ncbi:MAG: hypothetical protein GX323_02425 [Clostridiales bacterium]|nr:hypothetical protein [Clostridiales bacterium]
MKNKFAYNFIRCGLLGWCLECAWTGFLSLLARDKTLSCRTSLWMFPIYGLAAFFLPLSQKIKNRNIIIRGGLYTLCIFIAEYIFGSLLNILDSCPWDYSKERFHYKGIIRFDFAPIWFLVGLLYEKILTKE